MARLGGPPGGGAPEEQTVEEDDTADDQRVTELKPDADGDPMREQTEPVDQSPSSAAPDRGGHARAPEAQQEATSSTTETADTSQEPAGGGSNASAPSPDTGGNARAPEAPPESTQAQGSGPTVPEETTQGPGDASAPAPDRGGPARAPEAPPESKGSETSDPRPDVRREQANTPTSGGVAGPPGSGITVEPETRGQIQRTKERVADQYDDVEPRDLRVTGDRDGQVSFELTPEARQERFNDLVEGREGAVRAVGQQYQRQLDFVDFKQPGRTTPGGAAVPGPQEGMESRASDPGSPRAVLRGGSVLAAERDLENPVWTATVPDWVPGAGGTELFTLRGSGGDYEPVRDGNNIRFEQQDPNDIDYSLGLGDPTRDEVEGFLESNIESQRAGAKKIGDAIFGAEGETAPGSESLGEEALRAAGRPDLGEEYESQLESLGRGTLDLGPTITGLAVDTATEGPEFLQSAATQPLETAQKVPGQAAGSGAQALNYAGDNPGRFTGQLVASLAGTGAAFRATRGTRLGAPTRYLLQPGEEIAGAAGYRATKAATSERRAEQFFPNQEPILFSEEAAARAGRKGAATARRAGGRAKSRVQETVGEARARAPRIELRQDSDAGLVDVTPAAKRQALRGIEQRTPSTATARRTVSRARSRVSETRENMETRAQQGALNQELEINALSERVSNLDITDAPSRAASRVRRRVSESRQNMERRAQQGALQQELEITALSNRVSRIPSRARSRVGEIRQNMETRAQQGALNRELETAAAASRLSNIELGTVPRRARSRLGEARENMETRAQQGALNQEMETRNLLNRAEKTRESLRDANPLEYRGGARGESEQPMLGRFEGRALGSMLEREASGGLGIRSRLPSRERVRGLRDTTIRVEPGRPPRRVPVSELDVGEPGGPRIDVDAEATGAGASGASSAQSGSGGSGSRQLLRGPEVESRSSARSESQVENEFTRTDTGGRRLETAVGDLGTGPLRSSLPRGFESDISAGVAPRTGLETPSALDAGVEPRTGLDSAFESETGFGFESETRSVSEVGFGSESETRQASETELVLESESESRRELESDIDPFGGRRLTPSGSSGGERRTKTRRLIDPLTGL